MGAQPRLDPFRDSDPFLRHVDRKNRIRNGIVTYDAFLDCHETLSFTYQDDTLRTDAALVQYQRAKELLHGDLPGLCKLIFRDLTVELVPPLPPRHDPDRTDKRYGHLHCCTDRPSNDDQRRQMASLATRNGVVCEFIPKKKRTDL